jgi:hypothetical protein
MNRRVVDITPRSLAKQSPSVKTDVFPSQIQPQEHVKEVKIRRPVPRLFSIMLFFAFFAFVGVGTLHFFFAKAKVLITPDSRELSVNKEITAVKKGSPLFGTAGTVEAFPLGKEQTGARLFTATGKSQKQGQARGIITVYNTRPATLQTLVAGTRFVSQDGKLFRSTSKVVIPGAQNDGGKTVPGSLDVNVLAAEAGESYNIGPAAFSLPGLAGSVLYTAIYGKSSQKMAGGSNNEVTVVSQRDIDQAKDALLAELRDGAKKELRNMVKQGSEIPDDAFFVDVAQASSLAKAGAELNQFNVTGSVKISALAFSRAAFDDLLKQTLNKGLEAGERMLENTLQTGYEFKNVDFQKGTLLLAGFSKGKAYATVSEEGVRMAIQGKGNASALQDGEGVNGVKSLNISLWPFWEWKLPGDSNRINVSLQLESL